MALRLIVTSGKILSGARVGKRGQDHKGDDQRQVRRIPRARYAERSDHDLQTDELQDDVRHRRDDAGYRHSLREPAITEPAAHEIARCDVMVLAADVPDAREDHKRNRDKRR